MIGAKLLRLLKASLLLLGTVFSLALLADSPEIRLGPELREQAKYPATQQGAEVLHAIYKHSLDRDGHWRRRQYVSVQINDQEAARDYGRFAIPYNHFYRSAELEFANVLNAQGVIKPVAKDAIQVRVVGGGQDFYSDSSEIVFSLPDVAPGSIVEFQYVVTTLRRSIHTVESDQVWPYWFQRRVANDGWRADAVRDFQYQLVMPSDAKPAFKAYGSFPARPRKTKTKETQAFDWHWQGLPSLALEPMMPPLHELAAGVRMSTSKDWSLVDQWSWSMFKDKLAATDEIKALVRTLDLPANASREDKVRAVYHFMQNKVRYVFAHLGRGGYEPHFAEEVVANGYGDCKDQTALSIALLKALGVNAYPVLVETAASGRSDTELVSLIFDHVMVWVPATDSEAEIWMDTTSDRALYPGVSGYLKDQPALIVNGKGGQLRMVDAPFAPNTVDLWLEYRETETGRSQVTALYQPSGVYEENLRQWWKHDTNRATSIRKFLAAIFEDKGQYQLQSEVHFAEDLEVPATVEATYLFDKPTEGAPNYATTFSQLYHMVGRLSSLQTPESRRSPYQDPLAPVYRLHARFVGQQGVIPALIESGPNIKTPFYTLNQKGKTEGNDYTVEMEFRRLPLNLSTAEFRDYYASLVDLVKADPWYVSMQKDPDAGADSKLAVIKQKHPKDSVEYHLAVAEFFINTGSFEQALKPALAAVKLQPKNGHAWYILGTAQGFNAMIEESMASFEKSRTLGYVP